MGVKVVWDQAESIIEIRTSSSPWTINEINQQLDPIYDQLRGTGTPTGVIIYLPDPPYIPTDTIRRYRTHLQHQADEIVGAVFVTPDSIMINILFDVIARIAQQKPNYQVARTNDLDHAYRLLRDRLEMCRRAS